MPPERLVLLLLKDGERFVFAFDDEPASLAALRRAWGRMAGDPTLAFSWSDAALLEFRLRRLLTPTEPT